MAVTINASTSTGLVQSADTSGEIELQSNGTTALKVNTNEGIQILNCLGVGNATPSTSGAGITFPATQSASSDANTLDDYEEGTWTPTLSRATGGNITAVYDVRIAKYTKIGNLVNISALIVVTSVSSQGSGENEIRGLPFAPADNSVGAGSVARNNTFTTDVVTRCWGWSDSRLIFSNNTNSQDPVSVAWRAGYCNLSFSYFV